MSSKHRRWAWMKRRSTTSLAVLLSLVSAVFMRPLRANRRGAMDGEDVGFAVAVAGGFVAIATLVGIFFVPVATFTVFDQQLGAAIGVILLVLGIGVAAASR